jgi:hypothetical protein
LLPSHCTESFGWYCKVESLGKVLPRETLNKYSMSEDTSGDSRLFAGEGARATLVQSFPSVLCDKGGVLDSRLQPLPQSPPI